jgi:hypothetical protein
MAFSKHPLLSQIYAIMKSSLVIAAIVFILSACSFSKASFSDASKWIPDDFNPKTNILLIERYPMSAKSNIAMQDFLDKNYAGRYEIVDKKDILNRSGKYPDTKLYQFAFTWKATVSYRRGMSGSADVDPNGSFYDRANDKQYPTTKKTNNYGQKSYIPFFNSISNHFK